MSLTQGPLIIVMGVSGSGKSSVGAAVAEALAIAFVEGDALHPPSNIAKMSAGMPLEDEDRWPWLDRIGSELAGAADRGEGLVVSCSALKRTYRDRLRKAAGNRLAFLYLKGSPAALAERMARRTGHFMPPALLESQLATLESPEGEEGVVTIDVDGSKAAMLDAAQRAAAAIAGETSG